MLESLKEYFSSTINTAAQRVSNPVFGAFSLSWCAFNWKSILYLFLSDSGIIDKITYISDNSTWQTVALYPFLSAALLCGGMPWVNNLISAWQSRPLDNNDSIENHRKAKRIARATRLQRLQAKHDVTYDKVKTGAEKDIQGMKEQITESQARMGELTAQKEVLLQQHEKMLDKIKELQNAADTFKRESDSVKQKLMERHAYTSELEIKLAEQNEYIANLNAQHMGQPKSLTVKAVGQPPKRA
ncbi:TPA: hypothetical protein MX298_000834 [Escherichia coli]|nr:hypothetical protein [Escherichia coli]